MHRIFTSTFATLELLVNFLNLLPMYNLRCLREFKQ